MTLLSGPSLNGRFAQLAIAAACLIGLVYFFLPSFGIPRHINVPGLSSPLAPTTETPTKPKPHHPIDDLTRWADDELDALLAKETTNLHDAARVYRERRGRQPPPGFDVWFKFAQDKSALIIEDFFDRIYDDLNPFWGVPAQQIREQATVAVHRVSVRNHKMSHRSDQEREWLKLWGGLVGTIAQYLPDVDIPINEMDESRVIVPWEEIDRYMEQGKPSLGIVPDDELKEEYQSLAYLDEKVPEDFDHGFVHQYPYWPMAVVGCPPGSPARKAPIETDFSTPPPLTGTYPESSYQGYVKNWTLAKSPCDNAQLQGLHATFIEPLSLANTNKLIPLFGGSKLPMNNEILLPAAMYWTDDPFYSGGKDHGEAWRQKKDMMVWRGAASGGRNKKTNWTRFQRHRFIAMVNATSIARVESQPDDPPPNFVLPVNDSYHLASPLAPWIETWSDSGFVHLLCFPKPPPEHKKLCEYTDPWFSLQDTMPMSDQYDYKYLPDFDGNSFSGRYRGFLGSTSLPIKATIYQEWHDSRLVPWKHFVPMDNTFIDIYGIMEYFLGNKEAGIEGHDDEAKEIAIGGKKWAEKVLRKEDMQVYVLRLLLEYARVCDDDREIMGWQEGKVDGDGVT